jgi:serine/threonine protein kinase
LLRDALNLTSTQIRLLIEAIPHFLALFQSSSQHKLCAAGQGAFGVVHLCTKKGKPGTLYALKSMDKKDLLARQETEHALSEKEALMALSGHPFIVKT